ncbi:hypothetical protein V3C99_011191 [Haemonchus contortus]|uniref:DedA family protein n=1 Tax=Haemonchus contortus TaxID=6289 RepID=A0A7I4Y8H6_HAECO
MLHINATVASFVLYYVLLIFGSLPTTAPITVFLLFGLSDFALFPIAIDFIIVICTVCLVSFGNYRTWN